MQGQEREARGSTRRQRPGQALRKTLRRVSGAGIGLSRASSAGGPRGPTPATPRGSNGRGRTLRRDFPCAVRLPGSATFSLPLVTRPSRRASAQPRQAPTPHVGRTRRGRWTRPALGLPLPNPYGRRANLGLWPAQPPLRQAQPLAPTAAPPIAGLAPRRTCEEEPARRRRSVPPRPHRGAPRSSAAGVWFPAGEKRKLLASGGLGRARARLAAEPQLPGSRGNGEARVSRRSLYPERAGGRREPAAPLGAAAVAFALIRPVRRVPCRCGVVAAPWPVISGNGPSGICLSYMLSGYRPYLSSEAIHPNTILHSKLEEARHLSIVDQDLEYLSEGLEGRSSNPVAVLFDTLLHPDADFGYDYPSVLHWKLEQHHYIPHLVLGKGPPGGAWHVSIFFLAFLLYVILIRPF
uniref:Oxidative stress induced growth inhibitor family member 2 n=1 Tax=Equus asinus TaxID=9793 RepID=A0A9L0J988_EQUAS